MQKSLPVTPNAIVAPKLSILGHAAVWLGALTALHFALACNFGLGGEGTEIVPQTIETEQDLAHSHSTVSTFG